MKSNLIDIEVRVKHRTEKAVLVTADDESDVWLPLSQIEMHRRGKTDMYEITLPEHLAIDKELI